MKIRFRNIDRNKYVDLGSSKVEIESCLDVIMGASVSSRYYQSWNNYFFRKFFWQSVLKEKVLRGVYQLSSLLKIEVEIKTIMKSTWFLAGILV